MSGTSVPARYADGLRPIKHPVRLEPQRDGFTIAGLPEDRRLVWRFDETRKAIEHGEVVLHREKHGVDTGERIALAEADFEAAFGAARARFGRGRAGEASGRRIALLTLGALASLALLMLVGLPLLARVAAPLVPWRWEVRMGEAVEAQVLELFGNGRAPRVCGVGGPGKAALDRLVERLAVHADLPGPLKVDVLDTPVVNAFALPGGRIFLFRPVIERAANPDEVAGVIAHEIGHVTNRDAMRAMIQESAVAVLVGLLVGDVTGGTSVALLGKMMLGSAYSREKEREADAVSVRLMQAAGADPGALTLFFRRLLPLEGASRSPLDVFRSHPVTRERIATVEEAARAAPPPRAPILDGEEWAALRAICRGARP